MLLSTAVSGDPVALAMVLVLALIVAAMTVRKYLSKKKGAAAQAIPVPEPEPIVQAPAPAAPGSAGQLKLHDVEPKTAAMLMAIVAHQMGKPLNELRFISIREVK